MCTPTHPDLHAAVLTRAAAEPQTSTVTGPSASRRSLLADLANFTDRARRQEDHIRRLEQRLAETLGEQVWQRAGLGAPPDHDALHKRIAHLEQHNAELQQQLADRDDDLDAVRTANRQLIAASTPPRTGPDGQPRIRISRLVSDTDASTPGRIP
ncbi:hypothetical protein AABB02_37070 [Streptomyces rimosus]|uniref:hypothetical protein n=1 Tax=Streptomyces rimosus TaxID=1927 RepID=UPI0031CF2699